MTEWDDLQGVIELRKKQTPRAKRKTKNKPEAKIQKAILDWLDGQPDVMALRVNAGGFKLPHGGWFQSVPAGTSDILCCWRGHFVAIEVKAPGGRLTKKQEMFLESVNKTGGIGFVAYQLDDVKQQLPPSGR